MNRKTQIAYEEHDRTQELINNLDLSLDDNEELCSLISLVQGGIRMHVDLFGKHISLPLLAMGLQLMRDEIVRGLDRMLAEGLVTEMDLGPLFPALMEDQK